MFSTSAGNTVMCRMLISRAGFSIRAGLLRLHPSVQG